MAGSKGRMPRIFGEGGAGRCNAAGGGSGANAAGRRLGCEWLESRRLLAVDAFASNPEWLDFQESVLSQPVDTPPVEGEMVFLAVGPHPDDLRIEVPTNVNAADTTNTDTLQPGGSLGLGLTGAGYAVGVWEAGGGIIRASHQEFGARVTVMDVGSEDDHGTHVAGTIGAAGVNAQARGMASEVEIRSWTASNDNSELRIDAPNIVVSNHSYGFINGWRFSSSSTAPGGPFVTPSGSVDVWYGDYSFSSVEDIDFGRYDSNSAQLDDALYDNPHLLSVWSAGNDRNDSFGNASLDGTYVTFFSSDPGGIGWSGSGWYLVPDAGVTTAPASDGNGGTGFDTLSSDKVAKNNLVVGAINDLTLDPYTSANVNITSFSSYGPTDDGRIKPDVVGNGASLFSAGAISDTDYYTSSGTSMSAPNVAGTSVLVIEHFNNELQYEPSSATTKGVLIHTAADAGLVGPDYSYGWGVVDAEAAANFISGAASGLDDWVGELSYAGSEITQTFHSDGTSPLRATLVWTDPAGVGPASGVLDDPTPMLVNDLDLWITGPDGTHLPWTLDPASPGSPAVRTSANRLDNVEQVLIDAPSAGLYTVHVGSVGGSFNQDVSLLVSGAGEQVPGVELRGAGLTVMPTDLDTAAGVATADFMVRNTGDTDATAFDVRFFLSEDPLIDPLSDLLLTIDPADPGYNPAEPEAFRVTNGVAALGLLSESVSLVTPLSDPFETGGDYYLGMLIDADDEVSEVDELNNVNLGNGFDRDSVSYPTGSVPTLLPVNLTDGEGFLWDIFGSGLINNGTFDAYDGGHVLAGFPTQSQGEIEDNGREVVIGPVSIGAVEVTRKIYVPEDGGYARFLEIVTNVGSTSAVNYTVDIDTNLGSDSGTNLVATSDGDTLLTTADNWIVTDDSDGSGDPTVLHVLSGTEGVDPTTVFTNAPGNDDIAYSFDLTLAPGETQIVMHFGAQSSNRATALAKATGLEAMEIGALDGMSNEELSQVVNFNPGMPDLRPFYLLALEPVPGGGDGVFNAGDALTVYYDYENIGDGGVAEGTYDVGIYLSPDPTIDTSDRLLGFAPGADLGPDGRFFGDFIDLQMPIAGDPIWEGDGSYFVGVIVDDLNAIDEPDESNNAGAVLGRTLVEVEVVGVDDDADRLFAHEAGSGEIIEIDPLTGAELNRFLSPVAGAFGPDFGLAFDGETLYAAGDGASDIYLLDPSTGNVIGALANPGVAVSGLSVIGRELFVEEDSSATVTVIDLTTGLVDRTLTLTVPLAEGLGSDGVRLLGSDGEASIYQINPQTGEAVLLYSLSGVSGIEGIGVVGEELFVSSFDEVRIYDLATGEFRREFFGFTNLEALGADRLPPGTIAGVVWEDVDGDGVFDTNEAPLAGVEVYLDANNNGVFDAREESRVSSADGSYRFSYLQPGGYWVREVVPDGFQPTFPVGRGQIVLAAGESSTGVDFGFRQVDETPPEVAAIRVGSTEWSRVFRDYVDPDLGLGYSVGPPEFVTGMARLFAYESLGQRIVEIDAETGDVLNSFVSPAGDSGIPDFGLAFDGQTLYAGGSSIDDIYRLDPDTGATLATIPNPGLTISGLSVIGDELFVETDTNGSITVIDLSTDLVDRIVAPDRVLSEGIGSDGERLLGTDGFSLYEIDQTSGATALLYDLTQTQNFAEGIGVVGAELFVADFSEIDVYDLSDGSYLRSLTGLIDLEAIGADGVAVELPPSEPDEVLPWTNVDQLHITFTEDVRGAGGGAIDASIVHLLGVNVPDYSPLIESFTYDASTFTASLTLAEAIGLPGPTNPTGADRLLVSVDGASIQDLYGNPLEGAEASVTRFGIAPGDANQDGQVTGTDVGLVIASQFGAISNDGVATGSYSEFFDVTGNGYISGSDVGLTRLLQFLELPDDVSASVLRAPETSEGVVDEHTFEASQQPLLFVASTDGAIERREASEIRTAPASAQAAAPRDLALALLLVGSEDDTDDRPGEKAGWWQSEVESVASADLPVDYESLDRALSEAFRGHRSSPRARLASL